MRKRASTGGYALVLVLVFMVLLLSLSGLAFRHIGAALRIESIRAAQDIRDEGSVQALALAMALLGTGPPPSDPYECGVTIETAAGPRTFAITMLSEGESQWAVQSAPAQADAALLPMPETFAVPGE